MIAKNALEQLPIDKLANANHFLLASFLDASKNNEIKRISDTPIQSTNPNTPRTFSHETDILMP